MKRMSIFTDQELEAVANRLNHLAQVNASSKQVQELKKLNRAVKGAPMSYSSSKVTQNADMVMAGAVNKQVIGIRIVTSGADNPLNATQLEFTTSGTTNIADIANISSFLELLKLVISK